MRRLVRLPVGFSQEKFLIISRAHLVPLCIAAVTFFPGFAAESFAENHLYIGHSFFRPSADRMPFHATQAGIVGHTQTMIFSGGGSGAPQALWENLSKRSDIQTVLNAGDVDLFAMTYHTDYPTSEGYENWISYAVSQNPNTRFVLALPWPTAPESTDAASYSSGWHSGHDSGWHALIDGLRGLYPGVDIHCLPYGQSTTDLRLLFADNNLPDVNFLRGPANDALVVDALGHPGDITTATTELVWARMMFGIDLDTYSYDPGYVTDLKAIAQMIMDDHDAAFGAPPTPPTPSPGCGEAPREGCRTAEKSVLLYRDNADNDRDRLTYKWIKGQATSQSEFGDPTTSTQVDLCIYAGAGQALYVASNVPASNVNWAPLGDKGFKYRDSLELADGAKKIQLKGHETLPKSKIQWKGAGSGLPDLPVELPLPAGGFPMLIQISGSDTSACFETLFDSGDVASNKPGTLKLKRR
ncbi:MAG: hypothetical protein ACI8TX_003683 [Hyphomicrobiaceae bacterium]|jgi:hypothetical protein